VIDRLSSTQLGLLGFAIVAAVGTWAATAVYGYGISAVQRRPLARYPSVIVEAAPPVVTVGDVVPPGVVAAHLAHIGFVDVQSDEPRTFTSRSGDTIRIASGTPTGPQETTIRWRGFEVVEIQVNGVSAASVTLEAESIVRREVQGGAMLMQDERPLVYFQATPIIDALLASEDAAFWDHQGIDLKRLPFVWWLGGGASTLTQQVARMVVLMDRERTVGRKLREMGAAMAIERRYGKRAVLRAYLNGAYLGSVEGWQIRGFQAASQYMLGQPDARKLSVSQAATLVAMLNRPLVYLNDWTAGSSDRLRRQRDRVIRLMAVADPGRYPPAIVEQATQESVFLTPARPDAELWHASRHYLDYLRLAQPTSAGATLTSLVPSWQRAAVEAVTSGITTLERQHPLQRGKLDAALVAIDPESGEVVAMVGGVRPYGQSQFNRATEARRSAGSLVKAFVYLAAIRDGRWSASTLIEDRPYSLKVGPRTWTPLNYSDTYSGWITLTQALARSSNVAAARVAEDIGFDRVAAAWSTAIGRTVPASPALTLGATDVTPLEVARAYRTFARPQSGDRPAAAVREMLREVVRTGTASAARQTCVALKPAGKTGTSNDERDAWFVGFGTEGPIVVVWVGRDDNQPIGLTGSQAALPIWINFMEQLSCNPRWSGMQSKPLVLP